MLLISISLSITKFPPEQRVDQDGILQSALDRAREAPHRLPGTDLDPRCGASKASTVWRQVATAVWRQVATAEAPAAATSANTLRLGRIKVLIYTWDAAGLPQTSEP